MGHSQDGYRTQQAWRDIQSFLPRQYQLRPDQEPKEEWWDWRGHRIHLDRFANPNATAKVILHHGVGTNGRQMSTILGAPLFRSGFEAVAPDMPGYGVTAVAPGVTVRYDDWVQAASDFINVEMARDPRPIVLYGLSAGGMLAYHVAAQNKAVKGIVGMCFLDQREQQVGDETSSSKLMNRIGAPMVHLAVKLGLGSLRVPMRLVSKMDALVNDREALKVFLRDRSSAGSAVSQTFISTYTSYQPAVEPESFDVCPILLTQPAKDRWTPLHLSELFLRRIKRVSVQVVMLENAGHYPIEEPGLQQMHDAVVSFVRACTDAGPNAGAR